jgi:hypothetical protein
LWRAGRSPIRRSRVLGAFLLVCGSLFYFGAHRWFDAVHGVVRPLAVLGLPFLGLNAAAHLLYTKEHKAVAVAFYLAAVGLLPLLLIILFHETGFLVVPPETSGQLFLDGSISNRQLQVTTFVACLWCGWLALRTRTAALSTARRAAHAVWPAVLTDAGFDPGSRTAVGTSSRCTRAARRRARRAGNDRRTHGAPLVARPPTSPPQCCSSPC